MPKQIFELKEFVKLAQSKNAKNVKVKHNSVDEKTKFKLRAGKYLYTYVVENLALATRLEKVLPDGLKAEHIGLKKKAKK